jgi:hypothetical protein
MSRKIDAASNGALSILLVTRSRWKPKPNSNPHRKLLGLADGQVHGD